MSEELQFADSRALHAPFAQQLSQLSPDGALAWIDVNVGSPVAGQWGVAAALLDTPWPHIMRPNLQNLLKGML
ncbi:hypothetical protein [Janthinobacterium sp. LB3P112]|uniref:hypothetical protein n=1 Tax=Janthinobacterium sp. LB3P112 TaxID=3424196 RepID=UPI003F26B965